MKIAVLKLSKLPLSIHSDITNIISGLKALGVDVLSFSEKDVVPENVELYWNPGCGRPGPFLGLKSSFKPIVATFHGAANLALPLHECFGPNVKRMLHGFWGRIKTKYEWRLFENKCSAVIAVSNYAKHEYLDHLGFVTNKVATIYHGVDHSIFCPAEDRSGHTPYFLHVSAYQPKKNFDRILLSYRQLPPNKPRLVAVVPGYTKTITDPNIEIIQTPLSHKDLAILYRNAFCFLFPSLHETFGHPIIEAMASGCPVITSRTTACAEIADDAALLVDPRSVHEITIAMTRLLTDDPLRHSLRDKGIKRAKQFSWQKCAQEHLVVFKSVSMGKGI